MLAGQPKKKRKILARIAALVREDIITVPRHDENRLLPGVMSVVKPYPQDAAGHRGMQAR